MTRGRALGVLLVATGVGVVGRRYRRQLAAGAATVATVALPVAFVAVDLWDDITSPFASIGSDVKNFVKSLIRTLSSYVQTTFDWIWSKFQEVGNTVADAFQSLWSLAYALYNQLYGIVGGLISSTWTEAVNLYHDALHYADSAIHQLSQWVDDAVRALNGAIDAAVRWTVDNILKPLSDAIAYVWHHVVEPALDWLQHAFADLKQWAGDAFAWTEQQLGKVWDTLFGWAVDLLHVVEKCIDWLILLAEHGPTWVIQQTEQAFHDAPEFLLHGLERVVEDHGDELERLVAGMLG